MLFHPPGSNTGRIISSICMCLIQEQIKNNISDLSEAGEIYRKSIESVDHCLMRFNTYRVDFLIFSKV